MSNLKNIDEHTLNLSTLLAVGPGTGLGVALSHGKDIIACEPGAADFAPRTALQWALRQNYNIL